LDEGKKINSMNPLKFLLGLLCITCPCVAGNLNVVHLGPPNELKFQIKSGTADQEFTLSPQSCTGIFALPPNKSILKTIGGDTPALKVEANQKGRIAVLHPDGEAFKWTLHESKPSEGRTTLRLINLTSEAVTVVQGSTKIPLKAKGDTVVEKVTKTPIRLGFENGGKVPPYEQDEPSAVIGFVYRSGGVLSIFYLNDT
jgi:hypothetical protein